MNNNLHSINCFLLKDDHQHIQNSFDQLYVLSHVEINYKMFYILLLTTLKVLSEYSVTCNIVATFTMLVLKHSVKSGTILCTLFVNAVWHV